MDITFLVGNGFDLACNLKTKFSDFLTWYCKQKTSNACIEKLKDTINKDLEYWSDFEVALGEYTEKYTKDTVDDFLICYDNIIHAMNDYLKETVLLIDMDNIAEKKLKQFRAGIEKFYYELPAKSRDFFDRIITTCQRNGQNIKFHFISFNYTNTLDACIKKISIQEWNKNLISVDPAIIHVHGELDKTLILGVADTSQLGNSELMQCLSFPEAIVKTYSVNAIQEYWYDDAEKIIGNSKIICIFGMSLGKTDQIWWQKITKWLSDAQDRFIILFVYAAPPDQLSPRSIISRDRKEKEKLCLYSGWDEKKKQEMMKKIYIVYDTKSVLQMSFAENLETINKMLSEI